jgi:hypothetical protein
VEPVASQSQLQGAGDRALKAREVATRLVTDKRIAEALTILEAADEKGELSDESKDSLLSLVQTYCLYQTEAVSPEEV